MENKKSGHPGPFFARRLILFHYLPLNIYNLFSQFMIFLRNPLIFFLIIKLWYILFQFLGIKYLLYKLNILSINSTTKIFLCKKWFGFIPNRGLIFISSAKNSYKYSQEKIVNLLKTLWEIFVCDTHIFIAQLWDSLLSLGLLLPNVAMLGTYRIFGIPWEIRETLLFVMDPTYNLITYVYKMTLDIS